MIYFTSDTHFGHEKIVEICNRPTTIEDHDKWLIDIWNSTINKKDTVYHLGDFALFKGQGSRDKAEKILDKLHGNKILIIGNHDEQIRTSTRWSSVTQIKDFTYNVPDAEGKPTNIHIVLCHYPLASWNRKVFGAMHLYGHCHGRFTNVGLSFDVGIDAIEYKILSIDEVLDRMTKKSIDLF